MYLYVNYNDCLCYDVYLCGLFLSCFLSSVFLILTPTQSSTPDGIPVVWHASLDTVPSACPSFFLAHEFFDALPAHRFQYVIPGANEAANVAGNEAMTSSVTSPSTSSSASTSAQSASLSTQSASLSAQSAPEPFWNEIMVDLVRHESGSETDRDAPRFRLVRSRGPTLSSRTLTRLVDLAALAESLGGKDGGKVGGNEAVLRDGTQVEVAPGAAAVAGMIGERVGRDGGAALIVDYGEDHPLQDSLRVRIEEGALTMCMVYEYVSCIVYHVWCIMYHVSCMMIMYDL